MSLFLAQKRAEGLKVHTLELYQRALGMFLDERLPADVGELSPRHLIQFTARLSDPSRGLRPGGIAAYQRPVWVWLRWLADNDYTAIDISRRVRRVRVPAPLRRTATEDIRKKMLACALDRPEHRYRNAALIEVLWSTGVRRAELADLRLEDMDLDRGTVFVANGKGGKQRLIGIDAQARFAVERYIVKERGRNPGPLFLTRGKKGMTANAVRCALRSLAESAGVTVAAHDFRRACAARLRREGLDIAHVMRQLGHASPVMTLAYSEAGETEASLKAYHAADGGVRKIRAG